VKHRVPSSFCLGLLLASCQASEDGRGAPPDCPIIRDSYRPAPSAWGAARRGIEAADFTILNDQHDHFSGVLRARRGNESQVLVEVKGIDDTRSRISVRIIPWNREEAHRILDWISDQAGFGTASLSLFGDNWKKVSYAADLPSCVTSAHRTFAALHVTRTGEETHARWMLLDGLLRDSTPVRIRVEEIDPPMTQVTFIAGNTAKPVYAHLARRMKDEFEKWTPSE
jgi:hypothetical protein